MAGIWQAGIWQVAGIQHAYGMDLTGTLVLSSASTFILLVGTSEKEISGFLNLLTGVCGICLPIGVLLETICFGFFFGKAGFISSSIGQPP